MGRKKHQEEHVNLERWLVSYADFITLLFATFVVLYALAQSDLENYQDLQKSLKDAFAAPSIVSGGAGVMSGSGGKGMYDGYEENEESVMPPVLEYMSPKYEENAFEDLKDILDNMKKTGNLTNVSADITDRGLVIRLDKSDMLFEPGSARLSLLAKDVLYKVGKNIDKKFKVHFIRVEGHTDNTPMKSALYPSNWELSSARASSVVRYLLSEFPFKPSIFAAIGYADTKPWYPNTDLKLKAKNRRIEIIILRNKLKKAEAKSDVPEPEVLKVNKNKKKNHKKPKSAAENMGAAVQNLIGKDKMNMLILQDKHSQEAKMIKHEIERFEKQNHVFVVDVEEEARIHNSIQNMVKSNKSQGRLNSIKQEIEDKKPVSVESMMEQEGAAKKLKFDTH